MAKSVSRHGVLQPVIVRKAGHRYQLICGEQRWRAARLAGLSSIPAVVTDVDDSDRLELALIENVQRADLNPIELAHAFKALCASGATQEEVGERVSLDRSTVANHLRILELPREFQADVEAGRLSIGHAKALLSASETRSVAGISGIASSARGFRSAPARGSPAKFRSPSARARRAARPRTPTARCSWITCAGAFKPASGSTEMTRAGASKSSISAPRTSGGSRTMLLGDA